MKKTKAFLTIILVFAIWFIIGLLLFALIKLSPATFNPYGGLVLGTSTTKAVEAVIQEPIKPLTTLTGRYNRTSPDNLGYIEIIQGKDNRINISASTNTGNNKAGNTGDVFGVAALENGTAVMKEGACEITLSINQDTISSVDNGICGGVNVSFTGIYKKTEVDILAFVPGKKFINYDETQEFGLLLENKSLPLTNNENKTQGTWDFDGTNLYIKGSKISDGTYSKFIYNDKENLLTALSPEGKEINITNDLSSKFRNHEDYLDKQKE